MSTHLLTTLKKRSSSPRIGVDKLKQGLDHVAHHLLGAEVDILREVEPEVDVGVDCADDEAREIERAERA